MQSIDNNNNNDKDKDKKSKSKSSSKKKDAGDGIVISNPTNFRQLSTPKNSNITNQQNISADEYIYDSNSNQNNVNYNNSNDLYNQDEYNQYESYNQDENYNHDQQLEQELNQYENDQYEYNQNYDQEQYYEEQQEQQQPQQLQQPYCPPIPTSKPRMSLQNALKSPPMSSNNNINNNSSDSSNNNNNNNNNNHNHNHRTSKVYFKVSNELLKGVKEWEEKKELYQQSIKKLLSSKSNELDKIFSHYLQEMKPILSQFQFDETMKKEILDKEEKRLEEVKQQLFGSKNASILVLENQIQIRKKEILMHNKITLLQKVVRGWLARKRYSKLKSDIIQRNKCAHEIIETERRYVNSLELIINVFLVPLQSTKKDLLSASEITTIFSNCTSLYGVHKELLESLEKRWEKWDQQQCLAECFINLSPYLKLYTQYINNFNNAISTLSECKKRDSKVKDFFFKDCKTNPLLDKRDFLDLNIQPVQRIPRYRLLLSDLLKHTPEGHKDYNNIKKALEEIQNLANNINESKRNAEGLEKIMLIQSSLTKNIELVQPYRRHIKDITILFDKKGRVKERHLFIFNDSILLCKKQSNILPSGIVESSGNHRYIPITHMSLYGAIILQVDDQVIKHKFAILGNQHLYFYAKSAVEQHELILLLKEIVKELDENNTSLKREEIDTLQRPLVRESSSYRESVDLSKILNLQKLANTNNNNNSNNSNNSHGISSNNLVRERNSTTFFSRTDSNSSLGSSGGNSNNGNDSPKARNSPTLHYSPPNSMKSQNHSSSPLSESINIQSIQQQQQYLPTPPSLQSPQSLNQPMNNNNNNNTIIQPQINLSIRELIDIYNEICNLQKEIFQSNNNGFNQSSAASLDKLNKTLERISTLKNQSLEILKQEEISSRLQEAITLGKDHIGAFTEWIKRSYTPQDPSGQYPKQLTINLMKWYNHLFTIWSSVLDYKK
ncbi:hypothetical protein CYY_001410 [Polysphondylium violaceum]|uniref:DH domain-containing protein n=1 Tax=Polysphondylium violaceum TaxID=133409 RepID=A0A8J4Q137_9MYCE|nr:hypothetical protein CYY_001410 [Polysphondylium violaceum]